MEPLSWSLLTTGKARGLVVLATGHPSDILQSWGQSGKPAASTRAVCGVMGNVSSPHLRPVFVLHQKILPPALAKHAPLCSHPPCSASGFLSVKWEQSQLCLALLGCVRANALESVGPHRSGFVPMSVAWYSAGLPFPCLGYRAGAKDDPWCYCCQTSSADPFRAPGDC